MMRFAITHINRDGLRVLTFANTGRNHYVTQAEAQSALDAFNNNGDLRSKVLHDMADSLEIRAVDCYESGDAKRIYSDVKGIKES